MPGIRAITLPLTLAVAASAQTFVVDAANGPGTNYTSIAAAIAAVPDGAVLLVRAGTYGGFRISGKGLHVLGEPATVVQDAAAATIEVDSLAANQTVVLRGLDVSNPFGPAQILCHDCAGAVVVDGCRADNNTTAAGGGLVAMACEQVHVRGCRLLSGVLSLSSLESRGSNTSVTGSDISSVFASAVLVAGGRVEISACDVTGFGVSPVILMTSGELTVRGNTTIAGSIFTGFFARAINGAGSARVDPNTTLTNVPNPPYGPGIAVQSVAMPWLRATRGALGGSSTIELFGPAGGVGALLVGFPGQPVPLPGVADPAWLLPGTEVPHAFGGATLTASHAVPNAPWARGVTLAWQGATWAAAPGLQLSNPGVY